MIRLRVVTLHGAQATDAGADTGATQGRVIVIDPAVEADDSAFGIDVQTLPGVSLVVVRGEVDVFSSAQLRQVLFDPVLCSQPRIVIDLHGVSFMDSTGIGTLVAARRWATSREVGLALVCGEGPVLRLLEIVSLDKVFDVHASRETAVAAG